MGFGGGDHSRVLQGWRLPEDNELDNAPGCLLAEKVKSLPGPSQGRRDLLRADSRNASTRAEEPKKPRGQGNEGM